MNINYASLLLYTISKHFFISTNKKKTRKQEKNFSFVAAIRDSVVSTVTTGASCLNCSSFFMNGIMANGLLLLLLLLLLLFEYSACFSSIHILYVRRIGKARANNSF